MQQVDGNTRNLLDDNIEALKSLFPEAFTEDKIDFDKLQILLGKHISKNNEKYNFSWKGKTDAINLALAQNTGTLRPDKDSSKNWDTTQNLYLEGDNLEVLRVLQDSYRGEVKMIYIDPPYNTGKDFVYKDNYRDNIASYKEKAGENLKSNPETNGRYHTDWLNMMYPRLKLARNLLKDDGVIFISIDDNEVHNLRKICDEIFGEDNFVGQFNWYKTGTPPNLSFKIKKNIEYLLCYIKQPNNIKFKGLQKESKSNDPLIKPQNTIKQLTFKPGELIINEENKTYTKGTYGTEKYPNLLLNDLIIENGTNKNEVTFENRFVWTQEKLVEELGQNTKIYLTKTTLVLAYKKDNYSEEVPPNLIDESFGVGTTEEAGRSLNKFFENKKVFDFPKPISLLKYLINFNCSPNDLILDFFSGSATTAHAVMELNAQDNGNRRFILAQIPEETDEKSEAFKAGYTNICEIGKERIRRAGDEVLEENKDKNGINNLDTGFKVFKLDTTNLKKWEDNISADNSDGIKEELQQKLYDMTNPIKEDRQAFDMLYEIMLKVGMDLAEKIIIEKINDKEVYITENKNFIACLEKGITLEIAREIAEIKPKVAVFYDDSFENDSVKLNAIKQLEDQEIQVRVI